MNSNRLEQLDGSQIEVELEIQGRLRSVYGKGVYDAWDPDFGSVLRILVDDPSGDFEFLRTEDKWLGVLEDSDLPGCDCRISLANCSAV